MVNIIYFESDNYSLYYSYLTLFYYYFLSNNSIPSLCNWISILVSNSRLVVPFEVVVWSLMCFPVCFYSIWTIPNISFLRYFLPNTFKPSTTSFLWLDGLIVRLIISLNLTYIIHQSQTYVSHLYCFTHSSSYLQIVLTYCVIFCDKNMDEICKCCCSFWCILVDITREIGMKYYE